MKYVLSMIACAVFAAGGFAAHPNVIVILTDDEGTVDAPGFGERDIEMPHVKALGDSGIRLTQFYAGAPVCSPSRAALLTGRFPVHAGVANNGNFPRGTNGLPPDEVTLAEMFHDTGYATALIGKWHLGSSDDTRPNAQGFDYSYGLLGGCIDNYSHFGHWGGPSRHDLYRNGEEIHEEGQYFPDRCVEEAEQFVSDHKDKPFFMYFAINCPHYPYQGSAEWQQHYHDAGLKWPRDQYAAFLSTIDACIGRLLASVDAAGLTDKTIVVFQSDNGHSVEERAGFGGGSAGHWRGAKFSLFEGGIRVPAIIAWPGHLPAGAVRDQMVHACDWLPTLAGMCGVPLPNRKLDGMSLTTMLYDGEIPSPHEQLIWQVGVGENAAWCVRKGPWKLMLNAIDPTLPQDKQAVESPFLSNLDEDHHEQKNFAAEHADVVAELTAIHTQWLADVAADAP